MGSVEKPEILDLAQAMRKILLDRGKRFVASMVGHSFLYLAALLTSYQKQESRDFQ